MGTVASIGNCPDRRHKKKNKRNQNLNTSHSAPEIMQPPKPLEQAPEMNATEREWLFGVGFDSGFAHPDSTDPNLNKRTAVLLSNFHEEYQTLADEIPNIVNAQVMPNLLEHPMIHGIYCFVRDSENERDHLDPETDETNTTTEKTVARNEKSKINLPVLGVSQMSLLSLRQLVHHCLGTLPVWLILNVRSDPCLFSQVDNDWIPYTLRDYRSIQKPLRDPYRTGMDLDNIEFNAREEVLEDVKALRLQDFFFYDDITFFENQPNRHIANQPDHLLVSEEIYTNMTLSENRLRYLRLNFPPCRFPLEDEVDLLISVLRELFNDVLPINPFARNPEQFETIDQLVGFIVSGHRMHDGSIQLGMAIANLVLRQMHAVLVLTNPNTPLADMFDKRPQARSKCQKVVELKEKKEDAEAEAEEKTEGNRGVSRKPHRKKRMKKRSENQMLTPLHQRLKAGKFLFVRQIGRYLPFMVQIKEEVDNAIDDCDELVNLREEILETLLEMEAMFFSCDMDFDRWGLEAPNIDAEAGSLSAAMLQKKAVGLQLRENLIAQLERYYMLICFNAYLREQVPVRFSLSFSEWMRRHPKLYQCLEYLDVSEWHTTVDLIKQGQRVLLTDNTIVIDELCTKRTSGLANFRQLVGWPIYGAAQADLATVRHVQNMSTIAYWNVALGGMRIDQQGGNTSSTHSNAVPISMPNMIWVCLRNEYVVEHAGLTHTWRIRDRYAEPIVLKGISGIELEENEEKFVEGIKKLTSPCRPFCLDSDTNEYKQNEEPISVGEVHSLKHMFTTAFKPGTTPAAAPGVDLTSSPVTSRSGSEVPESYSNYVNQHAEYHRIPIPTFGPPPPQIFDQILRLVVNNARGLLTSTITAQSMVDAAAGIGRRHAGSGKRLSATAENSVDWCVPTDNRGRIDRVASTNLIFFCETGRERTSFAMAVAGLVYSHIVGFSCGYRVEEEERISLRGAKYTKGDFQIIQRLVRRIPNGNQVKREVDFVLDRCFDSMSMMHFHIREEIYFTYVKAREEKDPRKREELKRQSLYYLEEYFFLIVFNMYLHDCQPTRWKVSFEVWIEEATQRCNFMELLDNFGFPEFEPLDHLRRLRERWRPHLLMHSFNLEIA